MILSLLIASLSLERTPSTLIIGTSGKVTVMEVPRPGSRYATLSARLFDGSKEIELVLEKEYEPSIQPVFVTDFDQYTTVESPSTGDESWNTYVINRAKPSLLWSSTTQGGTRPLPLRGGVVVTALKPVRINRRSYELRTFVTYIQRNERFSEFSVPPGFEYVVCDGNRCFVRVRSRQAVNLLEIFRKP